VRGEVVVSPRPPVHNRHLPDEAVKRFLELILCGRTFDLHDDLERVPHASGSSGHVVQAVENPIDPGQVVFLPGRRDSHHRTHYFILLIRSAREPIV
jgi:hypothetical protein